MVRHFEIVLSAPRRKVCVYLWVFFLFFFLIEGQLLYRILLFSVKPQHESAVGLCIYTHIPSLLTLPPISLPIPPL